MAVADDAARYHRMQLVLGALGLGLGAAYLLVALCTGAVTRLTAALTEWPWWIQIALVAIVLGVAHRALVAPLAWVRGWWLPRRYGILHQPLSAWVADQAKAGALSALLALGGLELIYALLRTTPQWWWLAAAGIFLIVHSHPAIDRRIAHARESLDAVTVVANDRVGRPSAEP